MSIATVSRVMNGHHHVASETRALVHRAVERLGAPAPVRRGAAGGAIYVRCPYVLTDYFGVIVSSIAETLELHGRRVVLSAGDAGRRAGVLAGLPQEAGIAGAVLLLPPEPEAELETLRALNFPFVVVDPRSPLSQDIASVSAAHLTAARSVTAHLVQLGHRRIGVIGGPGDWLASQSRIAATPRRSPRPDCCPLPVCSAASSRRPTEAMKPRGTPRPARTSHCADRVQRQNGGRPCGPRTNEICGCRTICRSPGSTTPIWAAALCPG